MNRILPWIVAGGLAYYILRGYNTARVVGGLQFAVRGLGNIRIAGGNVEGVISTELFNTSNATMQIEVIAYEIQVNAKPVGTAWVSSTTSAQWQQAMFLPANTPRALPVPFKISLFQLAIAIGAGALSGPEDVANVQLDNLEGQYIPGYGWQVNGLGDADPLGAINWAGLWPREFTFKGRLKANGFAVDDVQKFQIPNPFGGNA